MILTTFTLKLNDYNCKSELLLPANRVMTIPIAQTKVVLVMLMILLVKASNIFVILIPLRMNMPIKNIAAIVNMSNKGFSMSYAI